MLKERGATDIRFLCLLAAPEGVARMQAAHPDVPIVTAALDSGSTTRAISSPASATPATGCSGPSRTCRSKRIGVAKAAARRILAGAGQPATREAPHDHFKVGYLVGSLAKGSINRKLAKALVRLAPPELAMTEIPFKDLPLYSYDYDADFPPAARAFKERIAAVDAVLFVTPGIQPLDPRRR